MASLPLTFRPLDEHEDLMVHGSVQPLTLAGRLAGAVLAVLFGLAAAMILWLVVPREARAEPVLFDCAELATAVDAAAVYRDIDASREKVVLLVREQNEHLPPLHRAVLEREINRLWTERRQRRAAILDVYKRCQLQLGDMGRDS